MKIDQLTEHDFDDDFVDQPPTPDPTFDLQRGRRSRTRRRTGVVASVAAVLTVASAVAAGLWLQPSPPASPTGPPTSAAERSIATYTPRAGALYRLGSHKGSFEAKRGCLYFRAAGTSTPRLVVFPRGEFSWDADGLIGPSQTFRLGSPVRLGADGYPESGLASLSGLQMPAACRSTGGFLLVTPVRTANLPTNAPQTAAQRANHLKVVRALAPLHQFVKNDGADHPNYAETRIDLDQPRAEILWKGTQPKALQDLVGTTESGVTISVTSVRYSQADISRAAQLVFDAAKDGKFPMPASMGGDASFDGLEVRYPQTELDSMDEFEVMRAIGAAAGIPAILAVGGRVHDHLLVGPTSVISPTPR